MRTPRRALGLLALALAQLALGQSLPYNPSSIFISPNTTNAYIFLPSSQSNNQAQLLSLDFSKTFSTSSHTFSTISDTLPFLDAHYPQSYTPTLASDGNLTVVAGNCSEGTSGATIWIFTPDSGKSDETGTWSQHKTSVQQSDGDEAIAGLNYLSNSFAFSQYVDGSGNDTSIYVFGGMCPFSNSSATNWISAAEYSNQILTLSPQTLGPGYETYRISAVANSGPPIAQAGSSLTALKPTYSISSSDTPQTQQQDFVLLGGQTQTAFMNTSQVALFSLPQQSWSFVPVLQPSSAKTDLAARQDTIVTPRSGHTAVLSEDGNSIVVFGGWVGDTSMAAEPQLAVLEFGSGYGGSGEWTWKIPQQSGQGPFNGAGVYGHGATMLPGGVLMIVGGYEIPASSSKLIRRDVQATNNHMFLYNTTSNTWLTSYNPPSDLPQASQDHSSPTSTKSEKVGLGTGLGIGAAFLVSVVAFYFWYNRRLKRARQNRERALLDSSEGLSSENVDQPFLNSGGIDGRGVDEAALGRFWPTGGAAGSSHPRPPEMQHTTGVWVNVPSPTRGLRRGGSSRNYQYQAAPRYDEKRISRGSGHIHPIAEQENEDGNSISGDPDSDSLNDAEKKLKEVERVLNSDDPFLEQEPNPLGSHPVSPIAGNTVQRISTGASRISGRPLSGGEDAPNWTVEPGQSDALLEDQGGRVSPSKSDDRTSSTLSEQSTHSNSSITRTMSTRTGAILAAAAAAHRQSMSLENSPTREGGDISPTKERTNTMSTDGGRKSPFSFKTRARSSTGGSGTPGATDVMSAEADSFTTAKPNFMRLQSEGEALLGGRPTLDRDDPYQRALAAHSSTQNPNQSAPSGVPPSTSSLRPRQGWMGSLCRALNVVSDRSFSLTSTTEQYKDEGRSSSSSPTKDKSSAIGSTPRRAVSDGGALLRQKRGQKDWDDKDWPPYRDDPDPGDWGVPRSSVEIKQAEEDWDVEGAASKRDVQIMFTVPKARLRVVNDDMDRASLRSASDGVVSRNGSLKNLRREESIKGLRARSDGDKSLFLPTTEEERDEGEKEKAA